MPTMIVLDSGVPPSVLTPEDMTPIMDSVVANIGVLLPIVLRLCRACSLTLQNSDCSRHSGDITKI